MESVRDAAMSNSSTGEGGEDEREERGDVEKLVEDVTLQLSSRIESARSLVKDRDSQISTLTARLDSAPPPADPAPAPSEKPLPPAGDKELKEEVEILKRENKLMASAWYELTGRLQSNTVLVSRRRNEIPKASWLGRQRVVVGGGGGGAGKR